MAYADYLREQPLGSISRVSDVSPALKHRYLPPTTEHSIPIPVRAGTLQGGALVVPELSPRTKGIDCYLLAAINRF